MNACLCDIDHNREVGNDFKLGMELDAGFCATELCPKEQTHAEIYIGGIKCIEFTTDAKFAADSRALSKAYQLVGECLEHAPIPMGTTSGQYSATHYSAAQPEMEGLAVVSRQDDAELAQATAIIELSVYQNRQLAPIGELPRGSLVVYIFLALEDLILSNLRLGKKSVIWLKMYLPAFMD